MAVTANQTITLTTDIDGDGIADPGDLIAGTPGDTVTITTTIANSGPSDAHGVSFREVLSGMTETGVLHDTPMAFDDGAGLYNAVGNVTLNISAGTGVLANDIDPNASGGPSNAGLTAISVDNTGTHGTASLNADADALNDMTEVGGTGAVSIDVGPAVWFIDNTAGAGGNGTQSSPFNSNAAFNAPTARRPATLGVLV